MCFGGAPSMPATPPPAPKPEVTKDLTASVTKARDDQKTKAAAALGQMGTVQTSPFGVAGAATTDNGSILGAK